MSEPSSQMLDRLFPGPRPRHLVAAAPGGGGGGGGGGSSKVESVNVRLEVMSCLYRL